MKKLNEIKFIKDNFLLILVIFTYLFLLNNKTYGDGFNRDKKKSDSTSINKIIVIGDTQHKSFLESFLFREDNSDKTKILFKEIAKDEPDLVLHLGDITSFGSSENQWNNYDEDSKLIKDKKIPVFPIFGNHDYYGDNQECYKNFYDHFPQIVNKKWYSFTKFGIGFIMLNSNFEELTTNETIEQNEWFKNQLDSLDGNSEIKYFIVCTHHPPYSNSTVICPDENVKKYFAVPFQKSIKGAIFFSGHCHSYERFVEGGKYFIVSGGGGGPLQKLHTDKQTRLYNDKYDGPEIRFLHFCEIEIKGDCLNFRVKKLNEDNSFKVEDELNIKKLK